MSVAAVTAPPAPPAHLAETVAAVLAAHAGREGALLPILHDLQAEFGYVPGESYDAIATALRLSRAEVAGVVGFYHDFRAAPAARHVIKLCRAEACQAMGGAATQARLERALGLKLGETGQCDAGGGLLSGAVRLCARRDGGRPAGRAAR